jgi:hypothetical protein
VFVIIVLSISSLGPLGLLGKFQVSAHCPAEQQFATTARSNSENLNAKMVESNNFIERFYEKLA